MSGYFKINQIPPSRNVQYSKTPLLQDTTEYSNWHEPNRLYPFTHQQTHLESCNTRKKTDCKENKMFKTQI